MRRTGLIVMAIVLAVPLFGECCFPPAVTHQCHESKHSDTRPCSANPVGVAQKKTTVGFFALDLRLVESVPGSLLPFETANSDADDLTVIIPAKSSALYLRTGALLI